VVLHAVGLDDDAQVPVGEVHPADPAALVIDADLASDMESRDLDRDRAQGRLERVGCQWVGRGKDSLDPTAVLARQDRSPRHQIGSGDCPIPERGVADRERLVEGQEARTVD
jgi:hypothetical protein